jgi:hypothetical protein
LSRDDYKEEFKDALFGAIEAVIEHNIGLSAHQLIMSYFNDTEGDTTLERAVKTIEKYSQKEFPPLEERSRKLKASLNRLAHAAEQWDRE